MEVQQNSFPFSLRDILIRLIRGYSQWYDFDRDPEECLSHLSSQGSPGQGEDYTSPVISAALHEEQGAYLLTRKATMWESHSHEFVYFFLLPEDKLLTEEIFAELSRTAINLGREKVNPDANHVRSEVTCLIVASAADESGLKALKKWAYRENFKMSLHGWMDGQAVLVTPEAIVTGRNGHRLEDIIESILYPDRYRKKVSGLKGWLRKFFR